jgi:[acyl-carrier-protein] S-malonyltransferase
LARGAGPARALLALVEAIAARPGCALYVSIELGGMIVFAGNEAGLAALLAEAPPTPGASRCGWSITARSTRR